MRHAALVLTILALAPAAVSGQAATMTFVPAQSLCNPGATATPVASPYTEVGYTISGPFLATYCTLSGSYAGPGLFTNAINGVATLTKVGGGAFTLNSIDLANLSPGTFGSLSGTFTGNLFGGGTVSQTFTIPGSGGTPAFSTYTFGAGFTNLTSVSFAPQQSPYYQFSNVQVNAVTATPEPASMTLLAMGLAGVFGAARRRRRV